MNGVALDDLPKDEGENQRYRSGYGEREEQRQPEGRGPPEDY